MAVCAQTWNDLLLTPILSNVTQVKYTENEWLNGLVRLVVQGSYDKLFIENPSLREFLTQNKDDPQSTAIKAQLNNDPELIDLLRTLIGIAYLQLFIINNFTGPRTVLTNPESAASPTNALEMLICDGETPVSTAEHLEYLGQALQVFRLDPSPSHSHWTFYWWTMRALFTHQKLLEERSMTLCDHTQKCLDQLLTHQSEMSKEQQILFFSEMSYVSQYYYNWKQADHAKTQALNLSGLDIHLTGQLGKRTRYQVKNTSQLLVEIARRESAEGSGAESVPTAQAPILPKDLALNDDVVLNQIQFENGSDPQHLAIQLNVTEQLTMLLIIHDRQVNNPRHEITTEEQLAFLTNPRESSEKRCLEKLNYLVFFAIRRAPTWRSLHPEFKHQIVLVHSIDQYLLARPINWSIQTSALTLRCKHETENKRKIERTLMQLQELIDQFDHPNPPTAVRLEHFHSVPVYPMWKLKSDVAHIYTTLGLINNALDLYLHLKKWTDVIECYQAIKKLSLAEHVIREQLKIKETPDLLCSLGEVTNEFEYFQRAWELSKERNGRAQRLMGKYYFNRGNYEKACEHLVKAVEINSLQHDTWFWLGSSAFRTEKWELGVRAYSRCTNIESDNFEAWNNLAACHTKLKQIDKAHKVFLEAIKCNFDNWKVWENFLWTSADCGEIDDVIQAYHRLIDLKTKYVDKQVLQRLLRYLIESDQNEVWKKIYQKSLELFGRLTAQVTNEADIWELYSDLCQLKKDDRSVEWQTKILQQLQRAHRCAVSQSWDNEISTIDNVVRLSNKLASNTIDKLGEHAENENFQTLCHSIRLALNSVLTRLKQKSESSLIANDQALNESIQLLTKSLAQLTEMLRKD